jgi:hypothetical protein
VVAKGFSPTLELTKAQFHFTPAAGKSLKTTDLPVDVTQAAGHTAKVAPPE